MLGETVARQADPTTPTLYWNTTLTGAYKLGDLVRHKDHKEDPPRPITKFEKFINPDLPHGFGWTAYIDNTPGSYFLDDLEHYQSQEQQLGYRVSGGTHPNDFALEIDGVTWRIGDYARPRPMIEPKPNIFRPITDYTNTNGVWFARFGTNVLDLYALTSLERQDSGTKDITDAVTDALETISGACGCEACQEVIFARKQLDDAQEPEPLKLTRDERVHMARQAISDAFDIMEPYPMPKYPLEIFELHVQMLRLAQKLNP